MQHLQLFRIKTIALFIAILIFISACADEKVQQAAPQVLPVKVISAEPRSITASHQYTGRFAASKRVELRARVSGYLQSINFKDGQMVKRGDVLFVIDQREFEIALVAASARYKIAKREFERVVKLRQSRSISEEGYETREQQLQISKAELDQARLNLKFTEIKAPFSGRVGRNLIDEGTLISDSTGPLTTVLAVNPIEFYFNASEADLLGFKRAREKGLDSAKRGAPYPVTVQLQDEEEFTHAGKINFLNNEISRDTGSIQVRAVFKNDLGLLEPGMFGRLLLVKETPRDVLVVPQTMIGTEQTRRYLYTVDQDNKVMRKYVELGSITDDGFQIILSGISEQDKLISGGLHRIRPGMSVNPTPLDTSDSPSQQELKHAEKVSKDKTAGEA